ncbi:hypothetical protein H2201_002569 [Coniosporium apollinis]|uniref:ABC transporter domain-containing protein n=1 Tax=Coniosporium apollinis TaxID=61459 RepID=A0ABQ9P035_9PEZI|nr:hypothetical protein H2201_002569 [Coniosporium apollinis]
MPKKGKAPESSLEAGQITVTAQQSRFHTDAVDLPVSKEILVKDLSISIGQREILSHAELHLQEGRHYALVGRNGTGKSTLLKAVAEGMVPGIPWSLRILLLGQTTQSLEAGMDNLSIAEKTVLQHVVQSNRVRERYLREACILSAALENTKDSMAPVKAFRQISHERLERNVSEARQIAARRSGARGLKARKALIALEEQLVESQRRVDADLSEIKPAQVHEGSQGAADMLAEIHSALDMINASAAEAKARTVLLGLGFSSESLDKPLTNLSGGWKTRCELACALCQPADVLLLDEPTNFLDLPSIIWLQHYVQELEDTTVVVVTHDRDFADAVAEELIVLRHLVLEYFRGNLSAYEAERRANIRYMTKMKEAKDRQKSHIEKTIQQNVKAAKKSGDDNKLRQAASRQKKLDERWGLEVSAKGTRFKLNRDLPGFHNSHRADIEVPQFDPPVRISFPMTPPDLRFPGSLVSLEKVSFAYGKKSFLLLNDITFTIHPGERIGIAGLNGSGKTTLISLIVGDLVPIKGTITRHPRATMARFSQQAVELLDGIASQHHGLTALTHLLETSGGVLTETDARKLLGSLGLQGQLASDVPIAALSGGQKVRLAIAKLLWSPPHLLVLDEVTTHLDADTILALVTALRGYEGALLVVTHDRFFMRCVVEGESPSSMSRGLSDEEDSAEDDMSDEVSVTRAGVVYRLIKAQLKKLDGGMRQYEEIAARSTSKLRIVEAG